MKKILLVALVGICFLGQNANAKYFTDYNAGVTITRIHVHSGGGITLHISGAVKNLDGCAVTDKVHLKGNLAGHQNMLSHAMMAFTTGKKVGLHASGCEVIPFWGGGLMTPIIDNLWVFK
ncbi:hypothetical protein [Aliikangiella coralliicola]|uniref:Uncharacterized protein n=1 Tax=Aliikangiella coralliicola TaxID=2592383 RepID=A0A545UBX2_9GAMM|nr:hypothetical protein [Aliikangiella coralliicola]TQV86923.1 hypothetical protein FLL46_13995 [Aliikangiella coralliicola]